MQRKNLQYSFVTNLIFLIGINLIIKPVWVFFIDRNVQLKLGFDDYGIFYALLNITYLFNTILDLGLTNFHQREVSQSASTFTRLFGNIFSAKWLLSILYVAVCVLFAWLWKYDWQKISWLIWLIGSQVLVSFTLFFRSTLSAMQHYFADSFISVLDKALMIVIIGFFLFFKSDVFSIQVFIIGQFVAFLITFLIALFLVLRFKNKIEKPQFGEIKEIIQQAKPFTMLLLWMTIYFRLDSVLVERLSPANASQESGIYAAAYRLLDMINMFAYLFSMLLYPMFSKLIAEKKSLNNLIGLSSPILLSTAWIIFCSMLFGKTEWLNLLYHRQDDYAANIMLIVIGCFFGVALQYVFSTAVTASGNLKKQNKAAFVAVVFNAIANFIFIPKYGALAAAIIAFITLNGIGVANYFLAKSIFQLSLNLQKAMVWILWAFIALVIMYSSQKLPLSFVSRNIASCFIMFIMAWLMKILPVRQFITTLTSKEFEH